MAQPRLTDDQVRHYRDQGYLLLEGLFDAEEMDLLLKIARADRELAGGARTRADGQGGASKLTLRNELSDDIYSAIVRSERVVRPMEQLLGGEVYHWHHKMTLKEARVGGAWEWHQDFGYWYEHNYCLFPFMASCWIAVDRAEKANGCMQIIPGSHQMGRIEHVRIGEQTGAEPERVQAVLERLPLMHVEMDPGTALFFDSNLLHCSARNKSDKPRWSLICCYNAARNDPYKDSYHPRYTPLDVWPDAKVREAGKAQWTAISAGVEN